MAMVQYRPWGQADGKIRSEHRDRLAVVYVRQSTRQQVVEHTESTRLQYALVERAVGLGWVRSRVLVIDDDLVRQPPLGVWPGAMWRGRGEVGAAAC
jgi:hypothetical protein